jgi:magnesium transporter
MLKMMEEPLDEVLREAHPDIQPHLQSVREHFAKLTYQLEEIRESLISLLSLQVSLSTQKTNEASHKANEVIRLLTILSAVIMPLNLIASIYGMNFAYIPETQWRFGYFAILGLMAAVGFGTLLWFRWKGWLNPRGPK